PKPGAIRLDGPWVIPTARGHYAERNHKAEEALCHERMDHGDRYLLSRKQHSHPAQPSLKQNSDKGGQGQPSESPEPDADPGPESHQQSNARNGAGNHPG